MYLRMAYVCTCGMRGEEYGGGLDGLVQENGRLSIELESVKRDAHDLKLTKESELQRCRDVSVLPIGRC